MHYLYVYKISDTQLITHKSYAEYTFYLDLNFDKKHSIICQILLSIHAIFIECGFLKIFFINYSIFKIIRYVQKFNIFLVLYFLLKEINIMVFHKHLTI